MSIKHIYTMSDEAIANVIGERIEQLRLEANITQEKLSDEVGITRVTYRKLIQGQGKFQTLIAVLRVFGKLELVGDFIPQMPFSPMALLELEGKKRRRASAPKHLKQSDKEESEW